MLNYAAAVHDLGAIIAIKLSIRCRLVVGGYVICDGKGALCTIDGRLRRLNYDDVVLLKVHEMRSLVIDRHF